MKRNVLAVRENEKMWRDKKSLIRISREIHVERRPIPLTEYEAQTLFFYSLVCLLLLSPQHEQRKYFAPRK